MLNTILADIRLVLPYVVAILLLGIGALGVAAELGLAWALAGAVLVAGAYLALRWGGGQRRQRLG